MDYTEKFVENLNIHQGKIVNVRLDNVTLPYGGVAFREVVEHPGGVTIIALDEDNYVYCVRQFRYPVGESLLETPAGKLEPGEDPFECAVRELSEETGVTAKEYTFLGETYPSPGFCREKLYIYMARDLTQGEAHLDEDEYLDVEKIHLDKLVEMVMSGEIKDGKTIIAILKAKRMLEEV